jgi:hypothetical protein
MKCTSFLVLLLAVGMLACAGGGNVPNLKRVSERPKVQNQLAQIGLAYINCSLMSAPRKIEDLMPFLENDTKTEKLLRDGTIVVIWGVRIDQVPNSSETILAYETDADDQGTRYVLMANGSTVKAMSNDEFQKAAKAKGN